MSSSKPKVIVCKTLGQATPILMQHKDAVDFVIWDRDEACDRAWLLENIKGAAGLMVLLGEKVDQELLDAAGPTLRVVSTVSVGYEHIDLPLTVSRGVRVGYTPDVLTEAVADVAVMLALMASRSDGQIYNLVKTGSWAQPSLVWSPFLFCGPQLSTTSTSPTRTVGFLGFGRIAQATLKRLAAFGITHCVYSGNPKSGNTISAAHAERDAALKKKLELQSIERVDLDRLARESDLVILLTPGGKDTYHAIGEDFLKKMKPMSVIVNAGRGTVVDSDALAKALEEKWIWGAGLDVIEGEPKISADHPLCKQPKCVMVPHIGSATFQTRTDMVTTAINNLMAVLQGGDMPAELK